ncbi:MAG TPA: 23S rRNA (guanosine(2251)-2'-O)-methyltransferase RlmB [Elusimicrobiales bacterium]|jgi:23S rRNA (guanosine2251-2'-O)-methyltransferase|nr:23S rRNA (guanosine(2251)-2'-O)-methyltransferase RlmB [Elusimicrobiales bacterium]HOL62288.1 23S rRNA (guanosine(2251)-2'-O)-methyltransferase RlmB [Elusimicrobiales bacterium]HPO95701.1 23S rRNA (guanosine(2251)-2'-O)-methyltransferase RlmB [Elusimicrobiales bacterium]
MRKYVYGINTVNEILKNSTRKIYRIIVENTSGSKLMPIIKQANKRKISVQFAPKRLMDKLTKEANHQNIIVEIDDIKYYSLDEAVSYDKGKKDAVWLCLDSITDPQNFGSIIRTAVCMGISVILFSENRSVSVTPSVEKIASGAVEKIKFVKVVNINQALIYLKQNNFWVYGADIEGKDVRKVDFNLPAVLVMGSEGEGIHQKTKEHCDELIKIPQVKDFDSLNVSIASAICMYEIRRRF